MDTHQRIASRIDYSNAFVSLIQHPCDRAVLPQWMACKGQYRQDLFCLWWVIRWWFLLVVFVYMISKFALPRSARVHQYIQVASPPHTLQNTKGRQYGTWDSAMSTHQLVLQTATVIVMLAFFCILGIVAEGQAWGHTWAIDVWYVSYRFDSKVSNCSEFQLALPAASLPAHPLCALFTPLL